MLELAYQKIYLKIKLNSIPEDLFKDQAELAIGKSVDYLGSSKNFKPIQYDDETIYIDIIGNKELKGSHIITFNTLAARAVLKDAGKALDVTASKLDLLTKLVDNVPKMTLKRAYTTNKRFNTAVNSSNEFKRLYASVFRSSEKHLKVVLALYDSKEGLTREEISRKTDIPATGKFTRVLEELEAGEFSSWIDVEYKDGGWAYFEFSHFEVDLREPDSQYRTLYVVYRYDTTAS